MTQKQRATYKENKVQLPCRFFLKYKYKKQENELS